MIFAASACSLIKTTLKHLINFKPTMYKRPKFTTGPPDQNRLIWVDMEMTGLDLDNCHILEVACIITDENLDIVGEGLNIVIHQPDDILEKMNAWCKVHHGKSGLTEESRSSPVTLQSAEMQLLSLVRQHTPVGKCPLAGNTVHEDKRFLIKYMPEFTKHLHYRIVDVSTIKELSRRWYPDIKAPTKDLRHRAMDDILDSIAELKFYQNTIFK